MKNFLRALRHALPYRRRLIASIVCALCAAVLWGLNFTSIYPVLKLLNTEKSPHEWVNLQIANLEKDVQEHEAKIAGFARQKQEFEREKEALQGADPPMPTAVVEQKIRDVTRDLSKADGKLSAARTSLYWHQVAKKYINKLLPAGCFESRRSCWCSCWCWWAWR
jgi:hypothetical protein